jgi:hypothetical protein
LSWSPRTRRTVAMPHQARTPPKGKWQTYKMGG